MLPINNVCKFSLEVCKFSCVRASGKLFESTISEIIMSGGMNSYYDLWQQERFFASQTEHVAKYAFISCPGTTKNVVYRVE